MKKLVYILLLVAGTLLSSSFWVWTHDGFGRGDVLPVALPTLVLALASALLVGPLHWLFSKTNKAVGLLLLGLISVLQTVAFIYALWLVWGSWIGAISFPFQFIWLFSIFAANLFVLLKSENRLGLAGFLRTAGVALLAFTLFKAYHGVQDALATEQNYDLVCVYFTPNDTAAFTAEDLMRFGLEASEANFIVSHSPPGRYWVDHFFRVQESKLIALESPEYDFGSKEDREDGNIFFLFGNDLATAGRFQDTKIVVVMNHAMKEPAAFREPLDSTLVLLQSMNQDSFDAFYFGEGRNLKSIELTKTDFRSMPHWTHIDFDFKGGLTFRGAAFQWFD